MPARTHFGENLPSDCRQQAASITDAVLLKTMEIEFSRGLQDDQVVLRDT